MARHEEPARSQVTLTRLLDRAYEAYADNTALLWPSGDRINFQQMGERVRRLTGGLSALGIEPQDRVVIVAKNCPELILVDQALAWGGFVRVPLSYRLHPEEILSIAVDCDARAIVVDAAHAPGLAGVVGGLKRPPLMIGLGSNVAACEHNTDELLSADEVELTSTDVEELAWLPYTSGTTGTPRGVMLSHRGIVACLRNLGVELPPVQHDDVVLHVGPLSHLSGWVGWATLVRGAAQATLSDFDARTVLRTVEAFRATTIPMVPTMVNLLLDEAEQGHFDLSSIHTILYGGSGIAPDRLARAVKAFGPVFIQAYGLTEIPFPLAALSKKDHEFDPEGPVPDRLGSAGHVTPFVEIHIVGDGAGEDEAAIAPGEIWARSDTTMLGYWNRPDATDEVFKGEGWVATGDVGRLDRGYLYIIDRKKDMIVSGGFNVFPSEVENAISRMRGVNEVAVIGAPDPQWGEAVTAVIAADDGVTLTEASIKEQCRKSIAGYKVPRQVIFVDELPKTGSGKLMRRTLRDEFWEGRERHVGG